MSRLIYADESATDGKTKCFGIGAFSIDETHLEGFLAAFDQLRKIHRINRELHWTEVRNSTAPINFLLDWLSLVLRSRTGRFDVVVVNTALYKNWTVRHSDRELAFYKVYTALLKYVASETKTEQKVFIDNRSDAYSKQDEAMEVIGNNMLCAAQEQGRLSDVQKVDSTSSPGVQIADLLTGLLVSAHRIALGDARGVNKAKRVAIQRAARVIGWTDLYCDTYPGSRLNVWHFPIEYRGVPETRRIGSVKPPVHVVRGDLC